MVMRNSATEAFKKILKAFLFALMLAIWLSPAAAQEAQPKQVRFPKGANGTVIGGMIKGYQFADYRLALKAGQTLTAVLKTSNLSNYFNVTAPGAAEAMHIGSTSGNRFESAVPVDGNYLIRVYLMRSAARRNETARYSLSLRAEDPSPLKGDFADGLAGDPDF